MLLPATQREWLRDNKRRELTDAIEGEGLEPILATAPSLLVFCHEYVIYKVNSELFTIVYMNCIFEILHPRKRDIQQIDICLKWNTFSIKRIPAH